MMISGPLSFFWVGGWEWGPGWCLDIAGIYSKVTRDTKDYVDSFFLFFVSWTLDTKNKTYNYN